MEWVVVKGNKLLHDTTAAYTAAYRTHTLWVWYVVAGEVMFVKHVYVSLAVLTVADCGRLPLINLHTAADV